MFQSTYIRMTCQNMFTFTPDCCYVLLALQAGRGHSSQLPLWVFVGWPAARLYWYSSSWSTNSLILDEKLTAIGLSYAASSLYVQNHLNNEILCFLRTHVSHVWSWPFSKLSMVCGRCLVVLGHIMFEMVYGLVRLPPPRCDGRSSMGKYQAKRNHNHFQAQD